MPITHEFTAGGSIVDVPSTTSTSMSWSHTSSGGSDCVVLIGFAMSPDLTSSNHNRAMWTANVTYGGVDAMFVGYNNLGTSDSLGACYWFAMQNLPSGMGQILHGTSVSYRGVRGIHQVLSQNGSGSTGTITVASSAGRKLVHVGATSGSTANSYSQNQRYVETTNQSVIIGDADGSASVTFSWNRGTSGSYGSCVVELVPVDEPQNVVTIRSIGQGERSTGSSTTLATSWTHNYDNNFASYPVAVVAVAISIGSSIGITCSVTYGGQAMTELVLSQLGSGTTRNATGFYYLAFPPTGTSTINVTTGGDGTKYAIIGESIIYENVQSLTDIGNVASLSVNVTGTTPGIQLLSVVANGAALSSPNQTELLREGSSVTGTGDYGLIQSAVGTGGTVNFAVSGTASTPNSQFMQLNPNYYNRDLMQLFY
jgi:hypothetical protein